MGLQTKHAYIIRGKSGGGVRPDRLVKRGAKLNFYVIIGEVGLACSLVASICRERKAMFIVVLYPFSVCYQIQAQQSQEWRLT